MNKQKRSEMLTRLRGANRHPRAELNYASPYELYTAVILSAQPTYVRINKATDKLYPIANTPEAIFALEVLGYRN